ncbi:MAG TPA: hypothetical protein VFZ78_02850 [Flavisolibacter sp.]
MITAVIFYKGGLAHYFVGLTGSDIFCADLKRYDGKPANEPPIQVFFSRQGECFTPEMPRELFSELFKVVQRRASVIGMGWWDNPVTVNFSQHAGSA